MRRPWVSGGIVLLILLAVAAPASRLTFAMGTLRQNQGLTPGVTALDYVKAHFATTSDPYVIVFQRARGTLLNARDLTAMRALERSAGRDREVVRTFGLPDVAPTVQAADAAGPALSRFLSRDGRTAVVYLVPRDDPTSNPNRDGLQRLRADARMAGASVPGTTITVGGSSAPYVDFDNAIEARVGLIIAVVLGMTYLFLFIAFRTVFLPLKAVLLNMLSVGASFGLLQLVFQQGYGVRLLGGEKVDGIPTWVLLFLFAFLFGLSMDYEVLLLTRIRESWLRTGNNEEAVAQGLEKTGRLISSAAVIMALASFGFILASSAFMKEMGLGLTVSILADATLIRMVLVPAIMQIAGRWNWWTPGFLTGWASRAHAIEAAPEPVPATSSP
jgi:RND superfamily putative drug exporter